MNAEVSFALTDAGAAESFAFAMADRLRFDHRRGTWFVWAGHRWVPDNDGAVPRLAIDHVRLQQHVALDVPDSADRKAALAFWLKCERRGALDNLVALARNLTPVADAGDQWDRDPWMVGVLNGAVDLRTGLLRDGQVIDRITRSTGFAFDPDAPCPRWEQFITEVLPDPEVARFVQQALGYSLAADMREQSVFLLHGGGSNGKSLLVDVVGRVLGDYAYVAPFSMFEQQQPGGQSYDLAALDGMRFVAASEGSGRWLHSARLKDLSGCEQVNARHPYGRPFTFRPACKIWLSTNELPRVADESDGLWRRIRQIPFLQKFVGAADNRGLKDELLVEAPGILAWLVAGCLDWQAHGLDVPQAVADATAEYRADSDPLANFLDEACEMVEAAEIRASDLYRHYQQWADRVGLSAREQLSCTAFGRKAGDRFKRIRTRDGWLYQGVARA